MKKNKRLCILLTLYFSIGQIDAQIPLSFEESLHLLNQGNQSLKIADKSIEIAKAERDKLNAFWYPSLQSTGAFVHMSEKIEVKQPLSQFTDPAKDFVHSIIPDDQIISSILDQIGANTLIFPLTPRNLTTVDLSAEWVLFSGGKRFHATNIGRTMVDLARESRAQASANQQSLLVESYYGLRLAQQIVTVREETYTEGYGSYLIPAVMMIIIFQTLLMVIGMVTGEEYSSKGIRAYTPLGYGWGVAIRIVAGKTSVYCTLYAIFAFFLLGLLPHFFSIPNIGNGLYIVLLLIPYLMVTSFLGLAASRYFTDSEAPLLMIAFFSVGLIFLSGVSYPMELMPWYWKVVHYIFPAAPGTLAFVKLNSMGASMADIRPEYITLWIQALIYFTISIWVYKKKLESNLIS